ncbi:MAG: exosortase-associated EpsI family protein [Planctomycetota bacterium]|jgi:hypothetical protein
MNRLLAVILAALLLVAGGVVHGMYADRWQTSSALDDAVARVARVPLTFGGWVGVEQPTDSAEYGQAGAQGYWARSYTKDGKSFLAILMVGRAGRMAVHTPEVCYRGAGFDLQGSPALVAARSAAGAELGAFWSATFVKPGTVGAELQLLWSWSDGKLWDAPKSPRWKFAGHPALYKLYVSHDASGMTADAAAQSRDEFLRAFLPTLNETLELQ